MARAKRTDRAEARRKYRAYLQAQKDAEEAEAQDSAAAAGAPSRPARSDRPQPSPQQGARLGLMAAARAAYHQPTYLRDLRDIRSLVFGSNAVWPVVLICVAAGAYLTVTVTPDGGTKDATLAPLLFQFIFFPVPLLPPMLAGFLAPRSTWLAGALASLIASVTLLVVFAIVGVSLSNAPGTLATASQSPAAASPTTVVSTAPSATSLLTTSPGTTAAATPTPAPTASASPSGTTGTTNTGASDLTVGALILLLQSLAFGSLMGAGSGWYKRFLAFTSGPRNPSSGRGGGQRSSQRRPPPRKKPA